MIDKKVVIKTLFGIEAAKKRLDFTHFSQFVDIERDADNNDLLAFSVLKVTNLYGETALSHVSIHGDIDMIELLIATGADVNAKDRHGQTILDQIENASIQTMDGHTQDLVIDILKQAGAK